MAAQAKSPLFNEIYMLLPGFMRRAYLRLELKFHIRHKPTYFAIIPADICTVIFAFVPTLFRKHPDNLKEIMKSNHQQFVKQYGHKTETDASGSDRFVLNKQLETEFPEKFELDDYDRSHGRNEWFIKYDGQIMSEYFTEYQEYAGQNLELLHNSRFDATYLRHIGKPRYDIHVGDFVDMVAILPCGLIITKTSSRDKIKLYLLNPRNPKLDPRRKKYNSSAKESVPTIRLSQEFVDYITPFLDKQFLIDDFGNITLFSDIDPEAFKLSTYSVEYLICKF